MQKVKQRRLRNKLSSAIKLIHEIKDTKTNGVEISENEKNLLSAVINIMKDNVKMRNLQEGRKNHLELQRENSKMCLVMNCALRKNNNYNINKTKRLIKTQFQKQ